MYNNSVCTSALSIASDIEIEFIQQMLSVGKTIIKRKLYIINEIGEDNKLCANDGNTIINCMDEVNTYIDTLVSHHKNITKVFKLALSNRGILFEDGLDGCICLKFSLKRSICDYAESNRERLEGSKYI
jgi:hypothetical protein